MVYVPWFGIKVQSVTKSLIDRWIARQVGFCEEVHWAFGLIALPPGRKPPPWVKELILRLFGRGEFGFLPRTNPVAIRKVTPEILGEILGGGTIFLKLLTVPDKALQEEERQRPEIRKYRRRIRDRFEKGIRQQGRIGRGEGDHLLQVG